MSLAFRLAVPAICVLAGCGEPNQLYMASHTVVGINAAVNPDQSDGWLILGYDRTFATIIPRSVPSPNTPNKRDAMSALACSTLAVSGITIKNYTESIATGDAAIKFAKKLTVTQDKGQNLLAVTDNSDPPKPVVKDFFSCFKDQAKQQPGASQ